LHEGESVNDNDLNNFILNVFELDIIIIGHNLKYDLEILEIFNKKVGS
jgi:hypothetical protein